jgi:hypothetical protein
MSTDEVTPMLLDVVKSFVGLMRFVEPSWTAAYLRCCAQPGHSEAKASYVREDGVVEIVDVLQHKDFFRAQSRNASALFAALNKPDGLYLLTVQATLDYDFQFEYADPQRWRISKLDGGTGIPVGVS